MNNFLVLLLSFSWSVFNADFAEGSSSLLSPALPSLAELSSLKNRPHGTRSNSVSRITPNDVVNYLSGDTEAEQATTYDIGLIFSHAFVQIIGHARIRSISEIRRFYGFYNVMRKNTTPARFCDFQKLGQEIKL